MSGFIKLVITAFAQSITSFLYIVVVMMTYIDIKKKAQLEESWLGFIRETVSNQLMESMLYGMIAGLLISFLVIYIGIPITLESIIAVWVLTLGLMLIDSRFTSFSYAAGIISIISLIFNWPNIEVSGLIALIGIVNLTEGLLILINGQKNDLPVIMKYKRFTPIGAHVLSKVWPVPLVLLALPMEAIQSSVSGSFQMFDWWPIFATKADIVYTMFPITIVLGYNDYAITQSSEARTKETGILRCIYSVIIIAMAAISIDAYWMKYVVAILTPVLYEFTYIIGKRSQFEGNPIYGAPWRGLRILDILPESIAEAIGIKNGDILLAINGKDINSEDKLKDVLTNVPRYIWVDIKRNNQALTLEYRQFDSDKDIERLGILFVPRKASRFYTIDDYDGSIIKRIRRFVKARKTSA